MRKFLSLLLIFVLGFNIGVFENVNADEACQIDLSDEGYTNIEMYINELAGDDVVYSKNPERPSSTEMPAQQIDWSLSGDIDKNGVNDSLDALLILKHAARIELINDNDVNVADITGDEKIDSSDALLVFKIAAKIENQRQYAEISVGNKYVVDKIEAHGGTAYTWIHELYPENGMILSIESEPKHSVSDDLPVVGGIYENTYIIEAAEADNYELRLRLSNERWFENPEILEEMIYFIRVK